MLRLLIFASGLSLLPMLAQAQQPDAQRIEQCRQAVLACQLKDGAVVAVAYKEIGRPALVEPYFAHLACSGVLAAEQMKPDLKNREFVKKWLKWYALRQKEDKGLFVIEGTRGPKGLANAKTKAPDSLDSYAALYMYVAGRYAKVTKEKLDPDVIDACLRMLDVLQGCRSPNGLFWNFPGKKTPQGNPPAEYLLDNVECFQGLIEIVAPLKAAGHEKEANLAQEWADKLAEKLGDFWSPAEEYYVCMYGDKAARTPFGQQPLLAEGVATVSALALFDKAPAGRHLALWKKLQEAHSQKLAIGYNTLNFSLEDPTIERVYLAALISAPAADLDGQRKLLRKRTDELLARNGQLGNPKALADGNPFPYCHRFGLMLIALASSAGKPTPFLPSILLPAAKK